VCIWASPEGRRRRRFLHDSIAAFKARLAEIDKLEKPFEDTSDEYMAGLKAKLKQDNKDS
jgi:hypothetical protein